MQSLNLLLLSEVNEMVKIYVRKIQAGEMTLEEVPTRWREAVEAALED